MSACLIIPEPDRTRHLGRGFPAALLQRAGHRRGTHPAGVLHQLRRAPEPVPAAGVDVGGDHPGGAGCVAVVLQDGDQALREVPGTGSHPVHNPAGKPDRRARGESLCAAGLRNGQVREGQPREVPARQTPAENALAVLAALGRGAGFPDAGGIRLRREFGDQRHDHGRHVRGVHGSHHPVDLADPQPGTHHRAGLVGTGLVQPPDGDRQAGPRSALRRPRPAR